MTGSTIGNIVFRRRAAPQAVRGREGETAAFEQSWPRSTGCRQSATGNPGSRDTRELTTGRSSNRWSESGRRLSKRNYGQTKLILEIAPLLLNRMRSSRTPVWANGTFCQLLSPPPGPSATSSDLRYATGSANGKPAEAFNVATDE